jgi:uncharacterized protein YegP (UPF0339 family)
MINKYNKENIMYELFEGKDSQRYWRLKARNGEVIAISEGYTSKQSAKNGIKSVKENADSDIKELKK